MPLVYFSTVPRPTPSLSAITRKLWPCARGALMSSIDEGVIPGRPSTRPRALARAKPALMRSTMIARSNSAKTPS
jgi:hypothetical protein